MSVTSTTIAPALMDLDRSSGVPGPGDGLRPMRRVRLCDRSSFSSAMSMAARLRLMASFNAFSSSEPLLRLLPPPLIARLFPLLEFSFPSPSKLSALPALPALPLLRPFSKSPRLALSRFSALRAPSALRACPSPDPSRRLDPLSGRGTLPD